ncbi:MAG: glycosyltransferase family 4 protein, partial [Luteolibacter sp.]
DLLPWVPKGMKKVVTVHDLIPLRFPGELNPAQQNRFKQWVSCIEQADAIVSVSEYTKREIVDLLKIPSSKIAVIPNGVEITKKSADRPFINDGGFVIGSIGSILQRKNLGIFVEALKYLKDINKSPITLLRVGPALPDDIVQPLLQILGTSGLVELGRIEDKDLPRFYDSLDCIVIPSLYEGFGLPVLEGLASRIPVVSSNRSSLPEVGKDIPLYFDPASPKDLANVLADLITEGLPQERIQRGFELADLMSWRKTLTGIYSVYETLL